MTDELTSKRAFLSWQPTDPTAERQILGPDRCQHVDLPPSLARTPSSDVRATAIGSIIASSLLSPPRDTLLLDGHELRHVLIHPASPDAALEADVRAWLANEPKRPTYDVTQLWAAKHSYSQRKAWAAVKRVASLLGKEPART